MLSGKCGAGKAASKELFNHLAPPAQRLQMLWLTISFDFHARTVSEAWRRG